MNPVRGNGCAAYDCLTATEVTKLFKDGKVVANDRVSLSVTSGEIFGLLGPNGAGKTTLLRQVCGLLRPTSGSITVMGYDVVREPSAAKHLIGYMAQRPFGLHQLTVQEALEFTARLRGSVPSEARVQAAELMESLGLGEHRRKILMRLSLGLLKAVCFGMAISGHPRLVFLDEPTESLDPMRRRILWDRIRSLSTEQGITFLLVTHNINEAESVLDRVAIMSNGRILALGTPRELKRGLDDRLRVELVPREGASLDVGLPVLREIGEVMLIGDGSVVMLIQRQDLSACIDMIQKLVGVANLEDFRVADVTLEDVYIRLGGGKIA